MTIKKKTTKTKTNWDLKLLYKSLEDPKIEEDVKILEKEYEKFAKKYSDKKYLTNKDILLSALLDYERLLLLKNPTDYLNLTLEIDSSNKKAEALKNLYQQRLAFLSNKILFFSVSISDIEGTMQKQILSDERFKNFWYSLKKSFLLKKHKLSEEVEKVLNLESQTSFSMWVDANSKLVSQEEVLFKRKKVPLEEANAMISNLLTRKERESLNKIVKDKLKQISFLAEAEINAVVTNKKINDSLRSYKNPFSETILFYENDEDSIVDMTRIVTKYFKISQRFYKLKAKALKIKKIRSFDMACPIGSISTKIPLKNGIKIIKDSFTKVDPYFSNLLSSFIENGQIDFYPRKGKSGGGFCSSDYNRPTYILMNYDGSLNSVMTLAHEMGHAIHGEMSKNNNTPTNASYTISTAEVASTFFEQVVFEDIIKTLSGKEKIIAMFDHTFEDVGTIFRQVACFNFEVEMHKSIREKGYLSKEELSSLMNKHMKSYVGDILDIREEDGYIYVRWHHIRNFFYVYSYAYGQLISKVLYKRYKENPAFIKNIKEFLSAGGSMSPEDIFKKCGLDTRDPKFFEEGLKSIEEDVKNLEKLLKKQKMI